MINWIKKELNRFSLFHCLVVAMMIICHSSLSFADFDDIPSGVNGADLDFYYNENTNSYDVPNKKASGPDMDFYYDAKTNSYLVETNLDAVPKDKPDCSFTSIKKQYLSDESKSYCWYCNIVSTMTNAYLSAVAEIMNILVTMGKLILRYGFLIWLAYYVLQQVSSLAPVKPSKMLQEILLMGFKVAVATIAVTQGIGILTHYFLDPVMMLGIDFGESMLNGVMEMNITSDNLPDYSADLSGNFSGSGTGGGPQ